MNERGKGIYLERGGILPNDAPKIHIRSSKLKCTMLGKNSKRYEKF